MLLENHQNYLVVLSISLTVKLLKGYIHVERKRIFSLIFVICFSDAFRIGYKWTLNVT